MSNLLGLITVGSNAMQAQNAGVATTGKNLANVNTEGYEREWVDIRALAGAPQMGGVRQRGPYRTEDVLLGRREQQNRGDRGAASAASNALGQLERAVGGASGSDLVSALSRFWSGFINLSAAPLDLARRQATVSDAQHLATTFQSAATQISQARADADGRIGDLASQANQLAQEIANLNRAMVTERDPVLADQRDLAAKKLAGIIGGTARIDADGMMRFVVAGGVVVVDGLRAATVQATPSLVPGGYRTVNIIDGASNIDVTTRLASGQMYGEIRARDVMGAQAATDLNTLATNFASTFNTAHNAGVGLDGLAGGSLFTTAAGGAVTSASDFVVAASVVSNPRRIAAAAAGSGADSGNNQNALALANLRNTLMAGSGTRTASDEAIRLIGAVGHEKARADNDFSVEDARGQALKSLRDSLSGVSIEEEMSRLSAFRRASEAAATFVQTVDGMLEHILGRL